MTAPSELSGQLGRYRILHKLGAGGMGAVYLAEDTNLGRKVALKVPHFDADASPSILERFRREARVAAGIEHPNLCAVYDVGEIDGVTFFTMPFVDGTPLSRLIDENKPWQPADAAALVRKVALAVHALHQNGIVHRDLKPSNILVRKSGEPVLMDFGLARSFSAHSQRLTTTGTPVGSPGYMAPEQVAGAKDFGPPTDVYGLAVIFYEMITGRPPFEGPIMSVFAQVLHAPAPLPSEVRPALGTRYDALCRKALAKKPEERFADMPAFAAALQELALPVAIPVAQPALAPTLPSLGAAAGREGVTPASTASFPPTVAPPVVEPPRAEPMRISCPKCGNTAKVPPEMAGRKVKCPHCGTSLGRLEPVEPRQSPTLLGQETLLTPPAPASPRPAPAAKKPKRGSRSSRRWGAIAGIIVVVAGLVVWASAWIKQSADRQRTESNFKQLAIAMARYDSVHGELPPAVITSRDGTPLFSWRVALLPYIEEVNLHRRLRLDEPWNSPHNSDVLNSVPMPKIFEIADALARPNMTYIQVFTGPGTAFEKPGPSVDSAPPPAFDTPPGGAGSETAGPRKYRISNIPDGTSNTLLFVEATQPVHWAAPTGDIPYSSQVSPLRDIRRRRGGAIAVMFDGTVRTLSPKISEKTLRALITPAGGEAPDSDW